MSARVVAHSVGIWLPRTMNWVHNQIVNVTGFDAIVLALTVRDDTEFPRENVYFCRDPLESLIVRKSRNRGWRRVPRSHGAAIRRHHPVLVHSHFGDRGWMDMPLVRRYALPHVVSFYGYDVGMLPQNKPVWRQRYEELFAEASAVLCEGPHMLGRIADLGCPREKLRLQPLGVDVAGLAYVPREPAADGTLRVLMAAGFREKKGIPRALEALARLRGDFPRLQITIIGDSTGVAVEEEEKRRILQTIHDRELAPITRLLGFVPHQRLLDEAYAHHVFLAPSITASDGDTEGGAPMSLLEMAATGMPVVSTDHCDIPEVVKDGVTGWLCGEQDADGLAECLRRVFADPGSWARLGAQGRAHVQAHFDVRVLGEQLAHTYESVLG